MNRKIAGFLKIVLLIVLFFGIRQIVFAADVNLTIRDSSSVIFTGAVALPTTVTSLNDNTSAPHTIDASSVLAVLSSASGQKGANFSLSNLAYYSSLGSLYLKCLTGSSGEKCDNWQYTVNDAYPSEGMDKKILSGGENIYVYFGPQNKILLSGSDLKTTDALTVTAQKYDYQNDAWAIRTGVTVGLTQPDPNNTFSPIEVKTGTVDMSGQAVFSSIPAGSYNVGVKEDFYFPTEALTVTAPPPPPAPSSSSGSGGGYINLSTTNFGNTGTVLGASTKAKFDLPKAFDFLIEQQKSDGSFGDDLYTDWTALALASGNYTEPVLKLVKYFGETKPAGTLLTDFERHAMALLALGLNPYSTDGENYVAKILAGWDGQQFGDPHEDNDDIFALIVLQNAGYKQIDKIIADDLSFVLGQQKTDGSWDESVDMTGAGMEALVNFNQDAKVKDALTKAENFLKQNQKNNGGWGDNASSTAWALEGITALNEKPEDWVKNGNSPLDFLATLQDTDGGIKDTDLKTKIWKTAYVASALSGKTWNQIMQTFEKPKTETPIKKATAKIPKKVVQKATPPTVQAFTPPPAAIIIDPPQKSWFARLWDSIFGN